MDTLVSAEDPSEEASYRKMCNKFNVNIEELMRPKNIDILISMRHNKDHPETVVSRDMVLWEDFWSSTC